MQFLLLHTGAEQGEGGCQDAAALARWLEQVISRGVDLHGSRLGPSSQATTVRRRRDGELIITDGPFAETKEQIAGYDLLECDDMDEAVRWASEHPTVLTGAIEVRALVHPQPATGLPPARPDRARYMMLVCLGDDFEIPPAKRPRMGPLTDDWVNATGAKGQRLLGSQLVPPAEARTVSKRAGELLVTDGPFAETKEMIAGFDILECAHLDEAIEVAAAHPIAEHGFLEVRPFRSPAGN